MVRDPKVKQQITDNGVRAAAGSALALVIVTSGDQERRDLEVFDDGRLAERLMLAARAHGLRLVHRHAQRRRAERHQAGTGHPA